MLTLVIILIFPLNSMYKDTNRFTNQNYELSKFKHVPYQIEIANFGSSHGQLGLYYEHENENSFNFALSSQTPEYDLMLLKDNLKHFAKGAKLIFPISYFTPYLFPKDLDDEFEVRNQRYYKILSPVHIIDFDWTQWIKENLSYLSGRELYNFNALINDDELLNELDYRNGNFPLSHWEDLNSVSNKDLKTEAISRWDYWMQYRANLDMDHTGTTNLEVIETYRKIVEICEENDLIPIFITLPVTEELNAVVDNEFFPIFKEDVQGMLEQIGSPIYLDYSHYGFISTNPEYFIDSDHLSKYGAITVTNVLLEDINNILNGN